MEAPQDSSTLTKGWLTMAALLFSLLVQGLVVSVGGRTPVLSPFDILLPLIVLYMLTENVIGRQYSGFPDRTILLLGFAYFMAQLLSLLFNYDDVLRSLVLIKITTFGFLAYWIAIAKTRTKADALHLTGCLVIWAAVVGLMLTYKFFTDWSFLIDGHANYDIKDEVEISIGRSNYIAALLVPIIPIAVAGALATRGLRRILSILAAILIATGLLITMSKGAMLALLAALICALPVIIKAGVRIRHGLAVLVVLGIFFTVFPRDLLTTNYEMIVYRLDNPDLERPELRKVAWEEFLRNPIVGVGPNCIYIYNAQYSIDVLHTHNFVLNILAELGLVGALPFFAIIMILIRRSYQLCVKLRNDPVLKKISIGIFVGLIATLFHGLVEPTFQGREYSAIFWICASLVFLFDPDLASMSVRCLPGASILLQPQSQSSGA